jgi:cyclophilin family peptidyl-prolyl cis-trans isomerase
VSQPKPSRRALPVEPDEVAAPAPSGRQAWLALLVMGVVILAVAGAGELVNKALEPAVPSALAHCTTSTQIGPHEYLGPQPMCITASQKLQATVSTTQGDFVIDLAPEVAPVTVNNFVVLAIHGYYNGLNFWKSEDWVVQGGDPRGDGTGGPGYNLPDETTATPWGLGAVGMARPPGRAVNGSQFFVQKAAWPGSGPTETYNRFGTVISGMDKVQQLTSTDTIKSITIKVF